MENKKNITVTLETPYTFEGETRETLDLNGLYTLTVQDMVDAQNDALRAGSVAGASTPETSTAVLMELAEKATGQPIEFFKMMPKKMGRAVKTAVQQFLMDVQAPEGMKVQLESALKNGSETVTVLDLDGIANMKTAQIIEAEERMAKRGLLYSEPMTSYYYAVVMAALATGIPESVLLGAGIRDGIKVKAVVAKDFFG